jgi:hypothetical protein
MVLRIKDVVTASGGTADAGAVCTGTAARRRDRRLLESDHRSSCPEAT